MGVIGKIPNSISKASLEEYHAEAEVLREKMLSLTAESVEDNAVPEKLSELIKLTQRQIIHLQNTTKLSTQIYGHQVSSAQESGRSAKKHANTALWIPTSIGIIISMAVSIYYGSKSIDTSIEIANKSLTDKYLKEIKEQILKNDKTKRVFQIIQRRPYHNKIYTAKRQPTNL